MLSMFATPLLVMNKYNPVRVNVSLMQILHGLIDQMLYSSQMKVIKLVDTIIGSKK
jgi:hypothetical protein